MPPALLMDLQVTVRVVRRGKRVDKHSDHYPASATIFPPIPSGNVCKLPAWIPKHPLYPTMLEEACECAGELDTNPANAIAQVKGIMYDLVARMTKNGARVGVITAEDRAYWTRKLIRAMAKRSMESVLLALSVYPALREFMSVDGKSIADQVGLNQHLAG